MCARDPCTSKVHIKGTSKVLGLIDVRKRLMHRIHNLATLAQGVPHF